MPPFWSAFIRQHTSGYLRAWSGTTTDPDIVSFEGAHTNVQSCWLSPACQAHGVPSLTWGGGSVWMSWFISQIKPRLEAAHSTCIHTSANECRPEMRPHDVNARTGVEQGDILWIAAKRNKQQRARDSPPRCHSHVLSLPHPPRSPHQSIFLRSTPRQHHHALSRRAGPLVRGRAQLCIIR